MRGTPAFLELLEDHRDPEGGRGRRKDEIKNQNRHTC